MKDCNKIIIILIEYCCTDVLSLFLSLFISVRSMTENEEELDYDPGEDEGFTAENTQHGS